MIAGRPFIFYSLLKSRAIQQLIGGRKIEKAWDNVCNFLTNYTTTKPNEPTRISLTAFTAFQADLNPEIADKLSKKLNSFLVADKLNPFLMLI